jgi:hypothetical protein
MIAAALSSTSSKCFHAQNYTKQFSTYDAEAMPLFVARSAAAAVQALTYAQLSAT